MLNPYNYTDFLKKIHLPSKCLNETFLEIYAHIDLALRELLADKELAFNTSRARFLYVVEEKQLTSSFKKAGSLVFNLHFRILDDKYRVKEIEKDLALYVFQMLYNCALAIAVAIELLDERQKNAILEYLESQTAQKGVHKERLDCYLRNIKEKKTKYGYPLFEILATDDFGDEITIYLWIETANPPFHRRFDLIAETHTCHCEPGEAIQNYHCEKQSNPAFDPVTIPHNIGRKIRFFDLSWSEKGYFLQNEKTSFVIEPDFLLDITAIAECFQRNEIVPELFFLKLIQGTEHNLAIFKGGFVNYLLDAVICQKKIDLVADMKAMLRNQFLKVLDFAEEDLNHVLKEIQDAHLKNLLHVAKFYQGKKITLEPSFVSAEYGLQGRMDALIEAKNIEIDEFSKAEHFPTTIEIFELKSGNPPTHSLWANHFAQVMGYNLLLNSVFQGRRSGHSSILYSKATVNPLRNVTPATTVYAQILMCRNVIVDRLMKLANSQTSLFSILSTFSASLSMLPNYLHADIQRFFATYHALEKYEKTYLDTMTSFVLKEMIAQKTGYIDSAGIVRHGYSALWSLSLAEKIKQKMILQNLKLNNTEGRLFTFDYSGENDLGGFREGDLLLIYPAEIYAVKQLDQSTANPLHVPIFKAVLKKISSNSLTVIFRNELLSEDSLNHYECLFAERDILESGYYSNIANMLKFFDIDKQKRDVFFGVKEPRFHPITVDSVDIVIARHRDLPLLRRGQGEGCHCEQSEAIQNSKSESQCKTHTQHEEEDHPSSDPKLDQILQKAAAFQDYFLIQGPPGTGKTSKFLISIIKQHLLQKNSPVVVLAFTNRAVEEICSKLLENEMRFILLGTAHTDADYHISSLRPHSQGGGEGAELVSLKQQLANTLIFVSTVANFQNEGVYLKKYIQTDLLIVDEASQLLENQLIGIIAYFDRFILIGDHFQLPAVSTQNIDNLPSDLTDIICINSLQESLFERLYKRCVAKGWSQALDLLPAHYRMHSDIASLVNPFYDDKLRPVNHRQFQELDLYQTQNVANDSDAYLLDLFHKRVLFVPTTKKTHSRYSMEEAQKTKEIIKTIYENLKNSFSEQTVGVICAWKLQVNLIISVLSDLDYSSLITVDTVERFQGSEREIIIYSTAISNPELMKNLQSLTHDAKVDRKLNVAISRAKEQFILLGNREILSKSPHFCRIIDF